jgi:hypothetical protein
MLTLTLPTTTKPPTLPCGCIRGEFLCPEAVRLWGQVNHIYEKCELNLAAWKEYDTGALGIFDAFYGCLNEENRS